MLGVRRVGVGASAAGLRTFSTHSSVFSGLDYSKVYADHFPHSVLNLTQSVVESASGCWVTFSDGRKVLDCASGIGATNTGHCHPKVVAAVQKQVAEGIHIQQNIFRSKPVADLMVRLNDITPPELTRFFFNASGSEAVESAVKLARQATGKPNIITFQGGFHGRTLGTLALTSSKYMYGAGFGPFMGGVYRTPFPYCHQCPACSADGCCGDATKQLHLMLSQQTRAEDTAAVIIEPVLGEGGYVVPPTAFMHDLRAFCTDNDIVLIADEVQSGFGRTGKMFAVEHFDVVPDILVMAKGIASGMALSGVAAKPELFERSAPGSFGGTYGANATAAAAACATLDVFEEEGLLANTEARGKQLMEGLEKLQARHPSLITDVRGLGLMVGVEFASEHSTVAAQVSAACLERDLVMLTAGAFQVVRFIPPLIITEAEMDQVLSRFSDAVDAVAATL